MAPLIDTRAGRTNRVSSIFLVSDLIGEGRFSEVYKAYNKMHNTDIALKIYRNHDQQTHEVAKREHEILEKLEKLNTEYFPVPKGFRTFKIANNNHPLLPMELCEYQYHEQSINQVSLEKIIASCIEADVSNNIPQDFWDITSLFQFILSLSEAVWMLHKLEIIHRDIKPSNILLKKKYSEKIAKPFFLDFNTSMQSGIQSCLGGTCCYLPPEVIAGHRHDPHKDDDLWAIGRIISELVYGKNSNIDEEVEPHKFIKFDIPKSLLYIIRKARSPSPENRFKSAEEFYKELEKCLLISPVSIGGGEGTEDHYVSSDEIIWARENELRIRRDILTLMSGEDEIPIFKEIKNKVSFLFATLTSENTKSFELKAEVIRLGIDAIPSIIEEAYKLSAETYEFQEIAKALGKLAHSDMVLAKKSIDHYCLSSDHTVRRLCQELCKIIKFFPSALIHDVIENDALFMPKERVDIADMCIRYSDDDQVLMPLNLYMCREYLIDENSYYNLKDRIATRIGELDFENKALLIVQDTTMRIWEDLDGYNEKSVELKKIYDKGISQLFADAYSSLGQEALDIAIEGKLPDFCDNRTILIKKLFMGKLAQKFPAAREWLFNKINELPEKNLYFAAVRLNNQSDKEKKIIKLAQRTLNIVQSNDQNTQEIYEMYLTSGRMDSGFQLIQRGPEALAFIKNTMRRTDAIATKVNNILKLLNQFRNQHRNEVVEILIDGWGVFTQMDYELTTHIIANYNIPNSNLKHRVIELLEGDCNKPQIEQKAIQTIQKIIERR